MKPTTLLVIALLLSSCAQSESDSKALDACLNSVPDRCKTSTAATCALPASASYEAFGACKDYVQCFNAEILSCSGLDKK